MITPEQHAEIRRLYYGEHWKVGTIAAALGVHHDTVRAALVDDPQGMRRGTCRTTLLDPYLPVIRDTLAQTTPAGKLQLHILAAIAEFERGRIQERVLAGLARARAQGKRLGRPRVHAAKIDVPGGSVRTAAAAWKVSKSTAARWMRDGR